MRRLIERFWLGPKGPEAWRFAPQNAEVRERLTPVWFLDRESFLAFLEEARSPLGLPRAEITISTPEIRNAVYYSGEEMLEKASNQALRWVQIRFGERGVVSLERSGWRNGAVKVGNTVSTHNALVDPHLHDPHSHLEASIELYTARLSRWKRLFPGVVVERRGWQTADDIRRERRIRSQAWVGSAVIAVGAILIEGWIRSGG